MPRYDGPGGSGGSGDSLYVAPEALARDGRYIHEPADRMDALVEWYESVRLPLGTPWGEGDDFARQMNDVLQPLEENLMLYLRSTAGLLRSTSESTEGTARNYANADEDAENRALRIGDEIPGGLAGRR